MSINRPIKYKADQSFCNHIVSWHDVFDCGLLYLSAHHGKFIPIAPRLYYNLSTTSKAGVQTVCSCAKIASVVVWLSLLKAFDFSVR